MRVLYGPYAGSVSTLLPETLALDDTTVANSDSAASEGRSSIQRKNPSLANDAFSLGPGDRRPSLGANEPP